MTPVLKTIDSCKISCGAASRKASYNPRVTASPLIFATRVKFSGSCVSIVIKAQNAQRTLKN